MKINKSKKGISLIVLVITIVVMIILASAIILSISSGDIRGKATEAVSSNDLATSKEVIAVAQSEWELKYDELSGKYANFSEYANERLEKAGINNVAVTKDGKTLAGIAAEFVKNNIAIGTEIKGYKLNNTTSYTTSGKENTCDANNNTETNPQPDTLQRQSDIEITWKYMGLDENGEALLVGSVTSNSPKMTLGGKGGYLNGPQELNDACKAMYSGTMGTARNINIDDVTRVLEYKGTKGGYYREEDGYYTPTLDKVMTINEIAQKMGYNMNYYTTSTPEEGKDIGSYKADYYYIHITGTVNQYNPANSNLIYTGASDLTATYWLASSCVDADFSIYSSTFFVRFVNNTNVSNYGFCTSAEDDPGCTEFAIRPVVTLNANVQLKYENSSWVIY